jgi:F-type H+-transporting ATPase subunit b
MERIFGLDAQLLQDTTLLLISVFFLSLLLSYLLFDPARKILQDRKEKIAADIQNATEDLESAAKLKKEYGAKLRDVDKEAEQILSEARQKALKNETKIINEAKEEAARIIARANEEAEFEKKRVADEMKQEMIIIAAAMAQKVVANNINTEIQESLVDETLKEMGGNTWQR